MRSVGLVFLDDLHDVSARGPAWASGRGLRGALAAPTVMPPPAVVIVARAIAWTTLEASADWLRLAAHVVLVIEPDVADAGLSPGELRELIAAERDELAARLDHRVTFVDVDEAGLEVAIDRALEIAARVEPRAWPTVPALEPCPAVRPGPWLSWAPPVWRRTDAGVDTMEAIRHLSAAACLRHGNPAMLDSATGTRLELATGTRTALEGLRDAATPWRPIAADRDGERWLRTSAGRPSRWFLEGPGQVPRECGGGWGQPIAIDPRGGFAWTGGRCWFQWRVLGDRGAALWTPSNHTWPCGHAKKLYGHADNDPLSVQLAADASTCVSTYEHDALVTPGLPLRWREVGSFALAERVDGEPRALVFERSDDPHAFPGDPFEADEDARDQYAVVTVGPSPALRYVVGLHAPTYRLAQDVVTQLGGPSAGWVAFDDQHREVLRGPGRLLAGWDRWLVVEDDARLYREDLIAGRRDELGAVERPIAAAVALPGSPNVVLFSADDGGAIRVV